MATWKEIKRRIKSIKNTSKITKAMELISTVKMKKAQELALEKKEYIRWLLEVLMNFNSNFKRSRYFSADIKSTKTLWIIITSNKWLCWGYNISSMKKVSEYVKSNPNEQMEFVSLWKRGSQFVARTWNKLIADFSENFTDHINFHFSKTVSRYVIEKFLENNYWKVVVFYNHFINTIRQVPMQRIFLPLTDVDIEKYFSSILWYDYKYIKDDKPKIYIIEPTNKELLEEALPMLIDSMFFDIMIESKASEHSSRMIAMKNAKDSANKFASKLTLQYNKARQAAITKEISEIVSWVESMKD